MDEYSRQVTYDQIPVTVVGGYLGAGKTTLINTILHQANNYRLTVLVNDFGELPIDAALIRAIDGNVMSLTGGCICCSYGNDLSAALMDILAEENLPDHLIIETSGVALPDAVANNLSLFNRVRLHNILVLADVETVCVQARDRYVGDTIDRQLRSAYLVLLNKTDLVTAESLENTQRWLKQKYPQQRQLQCQYAHIPLHVILDIHLPDSIASPERSQSQPIQTTETATGKSKHDTSVFNAFSVRIAGICDLAALLEILRDPASGLLRAKGYVASAPHTHALLQVVGSRATAIPLADAPPPDLQGR
ncbi:MAG: GTP-binding protein, partial [Granulosicoccus sp.]